MRFLFSSFAFVFCAACGDSGGMVASDAALAPDGGAPPSDAGPERELRFESLTPPRGGQFFAVAATARTLLARAHGRYLRSDDGGGTWRSQIGPMGCGGTPWLVAVGDDFFTSCGDGVHVSGDGGETWTVVEGVGELFGPEPATDGTAAYWVVEPGTVVRWNAGTRVVEPVPEMTAIGFPGHVSTLGALGTDGTIVYAASSRGSGWIDASAPAPAWAPTNLPGYTNVHFAFGGGEGYAFTPAAVFRRLPDHTFEDVGAEIETGAQDALLLGGSLIVSSQLGVLESVDGGVTWSTELPVRFDNACGLAVSAGDLVAASQEGLWARRRGAWSEVALHSHFVYDVLPVGDALLTLGTSSNSWLRRERPGAEWQPIDLLEHYHLTAVGDTLFSIKTQALHRSTDAGLSFEELTEVPGPVSYITELDGALIALFDRSLYQSTDGGETFTELGVVPAFDYSLKALLRVGETLLYWDGPQLFRSSDRMRTWERLAEPPGLASRIAVGDVVYGADYFGALFRSTDLGATWTEVARPAGATRITALESDGARLYAAAQHADDLTGAIYTTDRGESWQVLESETQSFRERALGLAIDGDVLYIGTEATGLWAAQLPSR